LIQNICIKIKQDGDKLSFEKGINSIFPERQQSINRSMVLILAAAILAVALGSTGIALGVPPCCAVGGSDGWSGADLLNNMGSTSSDNQQLKIANPPTGSGTADSKQAISTDNSASKAKGSEESSGILVQPSQVAGQEVILNVDTKPHSYIKGAVHIDYLEFADGSGRPKSTRELSSILGNAGISRSDPLAIYSEDPSVATYVYLILDYLGQEKIRLIEGGLQGWTTAGKPTESAPVVLPRTSYLPAPKSDLIATYSYLKGEDFQVVDARSSKEYLVGSLPGSENIPYNSVLDNGKIKNGAALKDLFTGLGKDKPIAVYSNSELKASLLWYALKQEGYNSRLYAGDNWAENLLKNDGNDGKSQAGTAPASDNSPALAAPSSGGAKPSCH
jgi:thiosulfate/3-mercaptopyruvate sulfurtransferase